MRYTVLLEPDEDGQGFTVTVPTLPGIVTEGGSFEEALSRAREAIALHVEGLRAHGMDVPVETVAPLLVAVEVPEPASALR